MNDWVLLELQWIMEVASIALIVSGATFYLVYSGLEYCVRAENRVWAEQYNLPPHPSGQPPPPPLFFVPPGQTQLQSAQPQPQPQPEQPQVDAWIVIAGWILQGRHGGPMAGG